MSYIKLLVECAKNRSIFEELVSFKVNVNDFTSEGEKSLYLAVQKQHSLNLQNLPTDFLPESMADKILPHLSTPHNPGNAELYLKNLLLEKQEKIRENITQEFLKRIKGEKDPNKKPQLAQAMLEKLQEIESMYTQDEEKSLSEWIPDIYNVENVRPPVSFGFSWLDDKVGGGAYRGLPSVVAGDSGHGKSTFMKNSSLLQALSKEHGGQGLRVLVISLELTGEYLVQQYLALIAGGTISDWRNFNIKPEDMETRKAAALKLAQIVPNLMIDESAYTPQKLAKKIRQAKGKYDVIWVDYFTALGVDDVTQGAGAWNKASRVITEALKEVKEVALIMLSQVTAENGKQAKTEKDHKEARLRYAKQLLNDTALEVIVFRDPEPEDDKPTFEGEKINLFLRKNRNDQPDQLIRAPFFKSKGRIGDYKIEMKDELKEKFEILPEWLKGYKKPVFEKNQEGILEFVGHMNEQELEEKGFASGSEEDFNFGFLRDSEEMEESEIDMFEPIEHDSFIE
jgi:replicative DNA helicase